MPQDISVCVQYGIGRQKVDLKGLHFSSSILKRLWYLSTLPYPLLIEKLFHLKPGFMFLAYRFYMQMSFYPSWTTYFLITCISMSVEMEESEKTLVSN